ncbi:MAG TPA: GGDEF domain-containing protein [Terracidiphilus sp.]|nr:GGDEF domain-containing protein [Terracidiphilus sp.]
MRSALRKPFVVRHCPAAVAALVVCLVACFSSFAAATPATLTSLHAIRKLTNAEASMAVPVDFEATVTYFRGYEKTLFVQDGDDAIYVQAVTNLNLDPGDRIRVHGFTRDSFRPIVMSEGLTFLHHGSVPKPVEAEFTPLLQAKLDCRYVQVHGVVISAVPALSTGHLVTQLELALDGGTIAATVDKGVVARLSDLLDAEVAVTGAEAGSFDGKMQQTGVLIHVASFDDVHIVHRPSVDAWSIPLTPMDEVLDHYNVRDLTPRVRIQGIITYFQPGRMAVLQEGTQSIRVFTPTIEPFSIGDRVQAIGEPFVENGFLTLKWGDLRTTGGSAPVHPVAVNWDQLASGRHAFDLVSIEGKVVTQVREHAQDVYIIAADGHLFSATVRFPLVFEASGAHAPPPMPLLEAGSTVRITGVAIHDDANPFNGPMAFGILLRSASDVVVIVKPSLLTVRNLVLLVTVLLVSMAAGGAWVLMLKRKVHQQTAALAAQKEAEAILERKRSRILEDINGNQPLEAILTQIAEFAAFRLAGTPCWCEVGDGIKFGSTPPTAEGVTILRHEIPSRSGPLHGMLFAAINPLLPCSVHAQEALAMGAWLATLAIETRGMYSDLVHRSEFDLLTDVFNRFSFERRLDAVIHDCRQTASAFGLIYIDLDDFKQVNDQYGHSAGDQFLRESAHRMKRQLRPSDMLARLGGDEFAVIVTNVRCQAEVEEVSQRLERSFRELFDIEGYSIRGSVSVGAAVYPEDGADKDSLLSTADAAMYVNKKIKKESGESVRRR